MPVAVEESRPLVRAGLEALLLAAPSVELVVGDWTDDPAEPGTEAVQAVVIGAPDVEPEQLATGPPAIVVADGFTDAELFDLLRAGAAGVLLQASAPDLLGLAIHSICAGGCFIDPQVARRVVDMAARGGRTTDPGQLTIQEQRVLALVARDLTNREIAEHLGLSPHTVKAHVRGAMGKLGATDRRHAVELARVSGLPGVG